MKLRDHPLLSYKGARSWPPIWLWGGGNKYVYTTGEVGVLKDVMYSSIEPYEKCFLTMEHEGRKYIGTLLVGDPVFCREIYALLMEHRGKSIQEIGDVDLSCTSKKE